MTAEETADCLEKQDRSTSFPIAKTIALVSSGSFREMYDFMVFGYYASSIAKVFSRCKAASPR